MKAQVLTGAIPAAGRSEFAATASGREKLQSVTRSLVRKEPGPPVGETPDGDATRSRVTDGKASGRPIHFGALPVPVKSIAIVLIV